VDQRLGVLALEVRRGAQRGPGPGLVLDEALRPRQHLARLAEAAGVEQRRAAQEQRPRIARRQLGRAGVPAHREVDLAAPAVQVADPLGRGGVGRPRGRDLLEPRGRVGQPPGLGVRRRQLDHRVEIRRRQPRHDLQLADPRRQLAARAGDLGQHAVRGQIVGAPRHHPAQLGERQRRVASPPRRQPQRDPRVEIPRPRPHQRGVAGRGRGPVAAHRRALGDRPHRRGIAGIEIRRVGELARGLLGDRRIGIAGPHQPEQALSDDEVGIDEHRAAQVAGRRGAIDRAQVAERLADAAAEQRERVGIRRRRGAEHGRGVGGQPPAGVDERASRDAADQRVGLLDRPHRLALAGDRRLATVELPHRDVQAQLPVGALDPAGDHPARAAGLRERRHRRRHRRDHRAGRHDPGVVGRRQARDPLELLGDHQRQAGHRPVEHVHARAVLERHHRVALGHLRRHVGQGRRRRRRHRRRGGRGRRHLRARQLGDDRRADQRRRAAGRAPRCAETHAAIVLDRLAASARRAPAAAPP
jgi:hypothetical protein